MVISSDISDDELDLSGDLGLDFVNTIVSTRRGRVDFLDAPASFVEWIQRAGGPAISALVSASPSDRRTLTAEARKLRGALVGLFRAVGSGERPDDTIVFIIDRALRAGSSSHRLVLVDGVPAVRSVFAAPDPLGVLTPIAAAAVEVARGADPARLHECAAADCRRWFVDTSKGGRRRWCSMARCGNRAKAARYRRRQAGGA